MNELRPLNNMFGALQQQSIQILQFLGSPLLNDKQDKQLQEPKHYFGQSNENISKQFVLFRHP